MPSSLRDHASRVVGALTLAVITAILLTRPGTWWDLHIYHLSFVAFWHHQPAYRSTYFMWSAPSTLLLFSPLGALDEVTARIVVRVVGVLCLFVAAWTSLAVVWERRPPWRWVIGVCAAFVVVQPSEALLSQGNVGVVSVPLVTAAVWCAARERWTRYGVLLGIALAVKPVAIALVLLPLLHRRWRAGVYALGIPLGLSLLSVLADPRPSDFFTLALPHLLHGYPSAWFSGDGSLHGVLDYIGAPSALVIVARATTGVGLVAIAVQRHAQGGPDGLRMAETTGYLILATMLASTTTWIHYALYMLPLLVGGFRRGSVMRQPLGVISLLLLAAPVRWSFTPLSEHPHGITLAWSAGMCLLAVCAFRSMKSPTKQLSEMSSRQSELAPVVSGAG